MIEINEAANQTERPEFRFRVIHSHRIFEKLKGRYVQRWKNNLFFARKTQTGGQRVLYNAALVLGYTIYSSGKTVACKLLIK